MFFVLWFREQTFVDLGCGNGFLVHILTSEGYRGYGIDLNEVIFLLKRALNNYHSFYFLFRGLCGSCTTEQRFNSRRILSTHQKRRSLIVIISLEISKTKISQLCLLIALFIYFAALMS